MSTKREKLIADLKAQQETALHDFDEKIAVYLNRLKATDIVQTRTGWQPNKDMSQFIKLFKHGTCGKIIEAFKELQRGLHERKLRLDDLNGIYTGVMTVVDDPSENGHASLLEMGLVYVKTYCETNNIQPSNDVNIVVMFEDLKRARRYGWSEKKQEWFFHEMNYEDMCVYFEFPNKETK